MKTLIYDRRTHEVAAVAAVMSYEIAEEAFSKLGGVIETIYAIAAWADQFVHIHELRKTDWEEEAIKDGGLLSWDTAAAAYAREKLEKRVEKERKAATKRCEGGKS